MNLNLNTIKVCVSYHIINILDFFFFSFLHIETDKTQNELTPFYPLSFLFLILISEEICTPIHKIEESKN